jgi:hypothetical protein
MRGLAASGVLTCELLLAAVPDAGLQVLQLDLDLLVVPQGLLALPPRNASGERNRCLDQQTPLFYTPSIEFSQVDNMMDTK